MMYGDSPFKISTVFEAKQSTVGSPAKPAISRTSITVYSALFRITVPVYLWNHSYGKAQCNAHRQQEQDFDRYHSGCGGFWKRFFRYRKGQQIKFANPAQQMHRIRSDMVIILRIPR